MRTEFLADAADFRLRAGPLLTDEARHNLILGIVGTLISTPAVHAECRLLLVSDDGGPCSAAVMTPPYNLIVSDTPDLEALHVLVAALIAEEVEVPGVIGNQPTIDLFVEDA